MGRRLLLLAVLAASLGACDQPFEPNAPVSDRLVLYSILSAQSDTQYVRVSTTYSALPAPDVEGALVEMVGGGRLVRFRDTTIQRADEQGIVRSMKVYVAYNFRVTGGAQYHLLVSTPSGLQAQGMATALGVPTVQLVDPRPIDSLTGKPITLKTTFPSVTGAYVMHFYLDYYVLIGGGWELHREEVPERTYQDETGAEQRVYPKLAVLRPNASSEISLTFDSGLLSQTRSRVLSRYSGAPVVFLQTVFLLTQIDNALYTYYFLSNGPKDNSTIRLDQIDFTNVTNGFGFFGSGAAVTLKRRVLQ